MTGEQLLLVTADTYCDKEGAALSPEALTCTPGSSGSFPLCVPLLPGNQVLGNCLLKFKTWLFLKCWSKKPHKWSKVWARMGSCDFLSSHFCVWFSIFRRQGHRDCNQGCSGSKLDTSRPADGLQHVETGSAACQSPHASKAEKTHWSFSAWVRETAGLEFRPRRPQVAPQLPIYHLYFTTFFHHHTQVDSLHKSSS